ncbi:hypothetical protein NPIL_607621 [Nephila pilipes]|uniref:Uncharacterized protein n=1 Tax=Nephila pilipes TaxID=299642 RepID=A0A8X6U984_NEPPI|nr:hypothetical protein NPIL_607621 [Nephila pilipes]
MPLAPRLFGCCLKSRFLAVVACCCLKQKYYICCLFPLLCCLQHLAGWPFLHLACTCSLFSLLASCCAQPLLKLPYRWHVKNKYLLEEKHRPPTLGTAIPFAKHTWHATGHAKSAVLACISPYGLLAKAYLAGRAKRQQNSRNARLTLVAGKATAFCLAERRSLYGKCRPFLPLSKAYANFFAKFSPCSP